MSKKVLNGVVISNKSNKTIVVLVRNTFQNKLHKKVIVNAKKYLVHDEDSTSIIGDKVTIIETRPISKQKHWIAISSNK